jgi:hypothetical protein
MSMTVGASGVRLLDEGERRLERSAETFTRASASPSLEALAEGAPDPSADLPQAVVDLIDGRSLGRLGALLIRTNRETEDHILDILA